MFSTLEVHVLRVLSGPPKAITVIVGAAPLRLAGMIVEYDHETVFG